MLAARAAVARGPDLSMAGCGRHGAELRSPQTKQVAGGVLKMTRNLTSACTRPATRRQLPSSELWAGA